MNTLRRSLGAVALLTSTTIGATAFAADAAGWPPPGQYRIDADSVTIFPMGGNTVKQTSHMDGATGKITSTVQAPGTPLQTTTNDTGKPNTWCVHAIATPPAYRPGACQTTSAQANSAGSSFKASCQGMAMDSAFRKIDASTWEHTFSVQVSNAPPPTAASRESMIRTMPGLTPEQRSQALAAVPAMADAMAKRDAAMAQARAELTQEIATGTPEEAANARQALAAMSQAGYGGSGQAAPSVRQTTQVKERWTLTGRPCEPGQ